MPLRRRLLLNEEEQVVMVVTHPEQMTITVGDEAISVKVVDLDQHAGSARLVVEGVECAFRFAADDRADGLPSLHLQDGATTISAIDLSHQAAISADAAASGEVRAATEGRVTAVLVGIGDSVAAGQALVVVEAMKMEHRHSADGAGTIAAVLVEEGAQVRKGQPLVQVQIEDTGGQ